MKKFARRILEAQHSFEGAGPRKTAAEGKTKKLRDGQTQRRREKRRGEREKQRQQEIKHALEKSERDKNDKERQGTTNRKTERETRRDDKRRGERARERERKKKQKTQKINKMEKWKIMRGRKEKTDLRFRHRPKVCLWTLRMCPMCGAPINNTNYIPGPFSTQGPIEQRGPYQWPMEKPLGKYTPTGISST